MDDHLNDVFVDVALECYRRVCALDPGSEDAEVAEHAISLALERRDSELDAQLLLHDVLRNSRHSLRRGRARLSRAIEERGRVMQLQDIDSPERICGMREHLRHLCDVAVASGAHGRRVLAGLLAGETSAQTAAAAGVSRATVERTVRRLRDAATDTGLHAAA